MDKNLCIDFDGVLHSYMTPWEGARFIPDPPVQGATEWLKYLINHTDYVVNIYSSRSSDPLGIIAMKDWLTMYVGAEYVRQMKFPKQKPAAYLTIDDRAICFRGTFPSVQELDNFKPWFNKYEKV